MVGHDVELRRHRTGRRWQYSASQSRAALSAMVSNTGWTSVGELADDPQDLARRRLLLERSVSSLLRASSSVNRRTFSIGDHRLVGERLEQLDLLVGERPALRCAPMAIAPIGVTFAQHRNRQDAAEAHGRAARSRPRTAGSVEHVRDLHDGARSGSPARTADRSSARAGNTPPERARRPPGSTLWCAARCSSSPSNRKTDAIAGAAQPHRARRDGVEHRLDVGRRAR